ncbi:ABC transporter substrate-binding protein [Paracoccus onubensis]|uniref:ABC transporter substrate-binding protein n=1 Tax=Paracoccus onubensis TaxID=1675788 RepID=UPI00273021D2|nr:ABC transporter substrate-binding protein [Paracoccus onubensis]MDP0926066.1 ABC transporter substrate-binding protein [Paracoccus onubensis]
MKLKHMMLSSAFAAAVAAAFPLQTAAETPPDVMAMAWNIDAISTFDPAQVGEVVTIELLANTCDRLMEYDPEDETNIVPGLAESYEVSEDGTTITFKIREGLTFPSGNPATAQEMAWSLHRVLKIGLGAAAALTEYGFTAENAEERITAPDDTTLVMQFDQAYPISLVLQAIAAYPVATLMDRDTIMANEVDGDMGNKYLATRTECVGPYHLARWNPGEVVILERNEEYWGEQPAMKTILIRHVAEAATQRLMLTSGDIDVARDLTPEDIADVSQIEGIEIATTLKPQLTYLALNNEFGPFTDPRARLALRYLLDYDAMGQSFLRDIGVIRQSPVQLGAFGALSEEEGRAFSLDIERARELLAEAGVEPGTKFSLILGTHPYSMPIGQHFQENAAEAGLDVTVERMANAQLFARVRGREFEMALMSWQTSVGDAHGMASRQLYNPDNAAEAKLTQYPSWRSAYFSEEYNQRVMDALLEPDTAKREELYHQLQLDQMQEGPQVFIFQTSQNVAYRTALKGWTFHGFRAFYNMVSK